MKWSQMLLHCIFSTVLKDTLACHILIWYIFRYCQGVCWWGYFWWGFAIENNNSVDYVSNDDDALDVNKQIIRVCFILFCLSQFLSRFDNLSPLAIFTQYFWPFFSVILSYPNDLDNSYARSSIPMWMHVQPCFSILPHTHSINIPPVVSTLLQKSSKTGKLMKCFLEVFVMTVLVFFQVENIYLSSSSKNKLVHFHIYLFYY